MHSGAAFASDASGSSSAAAVVLSSAASPASPASASSLSAASSAAALSPVSIVVYSLDNDHRGIKLWENELAAHCPRIINAWEAAGRAELVQRLRQLDLAPRFLLVIGWNHANDPSFQSNWPLRAPLIAWVLRGGMIVFQSGSEGRVLRSWFNLPWEPRRIRLDERHRRNDEHAQVQSWSHAFILLSMIPFRSVLVGVEECDALYNGSEDDCAAALTPMGAGHVGWISITEDTSHLVLTMQLVTHSVSRSRQGTPNRAAANSASSSAAAAASSSAASSSDVGSSAAAASAQMTGPRIKKPRLSAIAATVRISAVAAAVPLPDDVAAEFGSDCSFADFPPVPRIEFDPESDSDAPPSFEDFALPEEWTEEDNHDDSAAMAEDDEDEGDARMGLDRMQTAAAAAAASSSSDAALPVAIAPVAAASSSSAAAAAAAAPSPSFRDAPPIVLYSATQYSESAKDYLSAMKPYLLAHPPCLFNPQNGDDPNEFVQWLQPPSRLSCLMVIDLPNHCPRFAALRAPLVRWVSAGGLLILHGKECAVHVLRDWFLKQQWSPKTAFHSQTKAYAVNPKCEAVSEAMRGQLPLSLASYGHMATVPACDAVFVDRGVVIVDRLQPVKCAMALASFESGLVCYMSDLLQEEAGPLETQAAKAIAFLATHRLHDAWMDDEAVKKENEEIEEQQRQQQMREEEEQEEETKESETVPAAAARSTRAPTPVAPAVTPAASSVAAAAACGAALSVSAANVHSARVLDLELQLVSLRQHLDQQRATSELHSRQVTARAHAAEKKLNEANMKLGIVRQQLAEQRTLTGTLNSELVSLRQQLHQQRADADADLLKIEERLQEVRERRAARPA